MNGHKKGIDETYMPNSLSIEQLLALPPLIFGTIRWKSSIGVPSGDLASGFSIR
jgi:hypothetical protein